MPSSIVSLTRKTARDAALTVGLEIADRRAAGIDEGSPRRARHRRRYRRRRDDRRLADARSARARRLPARRRDSKKKSGRESFRLARPRGRARARASEDSRPMRAIPARRSRSTTSKPRASLTSPREPTPARSGRRVRRGGSRGYASTSPLAPVPRERVRRGERDRLRRIVERVLEQVLRTFVVECGDGKDQVAARRFGEPGEFFAGFVGPRGRRLQRRAVARDASAAAARRGARHA